MFTKKNENCSNTNFPKVIFTDIDTELTIGEWLGVMIFLSNGNVVWDRERNALNSLKKRIASKIHGPIIINRLKKLLFEMGVPSDETCTISKSKEIHFVDSCTINYDVHFMDAMEDGTLTLRFQDKKRRSEITLEYNNTIKKYQYFLEELSPNRHLEELSSTFMSRNCRNACERTYSFGKSQFCLTDGNVKLRISVCHPKGKRNFEPSKLQNEDELISYLLSLSFPIRIDDVYREFKRITSFDPVDSSSSVFETEASNNAILNRISLVDGKLEEFLMTRDGWRVEIDREGREKIMSIYQYEGPKTEEFAPTQILDFRKELLLRPVNNEKKPQ